MPAKPTLRCERCNKWLTGHGKRTTQMCLDCWRAEQRQTKTKYTCKDCGGPCSETGAKGLGRCRTCAQKVRAAKVTRCLDCGKQTKQHAERCRPCWLAHLSSLDMTQRMAQGRATALKTKVRISKPEIQMMELLDQAAEPYQHSVPIERRIIDFVLPERRAVIEVHGAYWHDRQTAIERDERKRVRLTELGYQVLYVRTEQTHLWWQLLESKLGLKFPSTT